jgi:fimbrial isopeptide formation D2 family protein
VRRSFSKKVLVGIVSAIMFAVFLTAMNPASVEAAGSVTKVSNFAQLKSALEGGAAEVELIGSTYTATSHIGGTSSYQYLNHDVVIHGNGKVLNMGIYQFNLRGSHNLEIENLTINNSTKGQTGGGSVFSLAGDGTAFRPVNWNAVFTNVTYNGSSLIGTNENDSATPKRYFNNVEFNGTNNITLTKSALTNVVVYARNIMINGTLDIHDELTASGTNRPYYFKSPGTGSAQCESGGTAAYGTFQVAQDANVTLRRSPGYESNCGYNYNYGYNYGFNCGINTAMGITSAYHRSLVYGYEQFIFAENSVFDAKAGTNRTGYDVLDTRSAIIRSNNATAFLVKSGAEVNLETDLTDSSTNSARNNYYGFTALSLRKNNHLDITVENGALLNVNAAGTNACFRSAAPVVIWGNGSSTATTAGALTVRSENGNGWYYKSCAVSGDADFIVESTGSVDILANNQGVLGNKEYAAFEAYGAYNTYIVVRDGGQMSVVGNGARGMSLAGGGSYARKDILVTGADSNLYIGGNHWAISAEAQPTLFVKAENGGKIDLETLGDVGNGLSMSGDTPSTLYSQGPATYTVDGDGSEFTVRHAGGNYGSIYHIGCGVLTIDVLNGGVMNVDNTNSGAYTSLRRATITAENTSTGFGNTYRTNEITVDGAGSALNIVNSNSQEGCVTGQYPTGAVAFNCTAKGNITVKDGGSLIASSSSLSPTINLYMGKVTLDRPGEVDIKNHSLASQPSNCLSNRYKNKGLAVFNGRCDTGAYEALPIALEVIESDVTVWSPYETPFEDSKIDNSWGGVTFTAKNYQDTRMAYPGTGGDTTLDLSIFRLSAYGRIYVRGTDTERQPVLTGSKTVKDTARTDGNTTVGNTLTYTITIKNEEMFSTLTNPVLTDVIPEGVDFDSNSKVYVNGIQTTDYTYQNGVLTVPLPDIAGGQSVECSFTVTVNEDAYDIGNITNTAEVTGDNGYIQVSDGGIQVVPSDDIEPTGKKISKNMDRDSVKGQVGDTIQYTITASNDRPYSIWKNVYVVDTIPEEVDFLDGMKVYLDGQEVEYEYDIATRQLVVALGDLDGGTYNGDGKDVKELVFYVAINNLGYNKNIYNTAKIEGDYYSKTLSPYLFELENESRQISIETVGSRQKIILYVTDGGQQVGEE